MSDSTSYKANTLPTVMHSIEQDDAQSISSQNNMPSAPQPDSTQRVEETNRTFQTSPAEPSMKHTERPRMYIRNNPDLDLPDWLTRDEEPTSGGEGGEPDSDIDYLFAESRRIVQACVRPNLISSLSESPEAGVSPGSVLKRSRTMMDEQDDSGRAGRNGDGSAKRPRTVIDLSVDESADALKASTSSPALSTGYGSSSPSPEPSLKRPYSILADPEDDEEDMQLAECRAAKMFDWKEDEDIQRSERRARKVPRRMAKLTANESHDSPQAPSNKPASTIIDLTGPSPEPEPPARETYLHRLPAELRNRIYHYIGLKSARLDLATTDEPPLTIAIPDLRDELHSIIFSENKLRVNIFSEVRKGAPDLLSEGETPPPVGKIDVPHDHWMWKVDPRFVNIKHICFRVCNQLSGDKLCDFFVNVRMIDGKLAAKGRMDMASQGLRHVLRPLGDLARAKLKSFAAREGFEGLSWEDAREVAACFVSPEDAEARFTKKYGKVTLM